jgi:hypothetical protein
MKSQFPTCPVILDKELGMKKPGKSYISKSYRKTDKKLTLAGINTSAPILS